MYPLCCIDIRNFLNQIYLFSDDNFDRSSVIDDNLKNVSPTHIPLPIPQYDTTDLPLLVRGGCIKLSDYGAVP